MLADVESEPKLKEAKCAVTGRPPWQRRRAEIFIRAMLRGGPVRSTQVSLAAGGISPRTLRRARKALGVLAYRRDNHWYYDWPRDALGPLFEGLSSPLPKKG
jgi:hypothetical protein